jgi:hypothetical protein
MAAASSSRHPGTNLALAAPPGSVARSLHTCAAECQVSSDDDDDDDDDDHVRYLPAWHYYGMLTR